MRIGTRPNTRSLPAAEPTVGFEPTTNRLQGGRSTGLSYVGKLRKERKAGIQGSAEKG